MTAEHRANDGAIRVLIVDDHGLVRTGLRLMLEDEPDMVVLGEAADGEQALQLASELQPDVMLLDVTMAPPDGIQVAQRLRDDRSEVRVLMLTMHEDPELVRASFAAGAAGYMVKRSVTDELVEAIRIVAGGGSYVHPSVQGSVAG